MFGWPFNACTVSAAVDDKDELPDPTPMPTRTVSRSVPDTEMSRALKMMQHNYDFLGLTGHGLYSVVEDCENAICDGDESRARDILERLEHEVELEITTLTAAFNLFKKPKEDSLSETEVRTMLDYLGFPKEDEDVEKIMSAVDTDGDRRMGIEEFRLYVGRMGGSLRLFEVRRKQMEAKHGHSGEAVDPATVRMSLLEAGIRDDAQAYWRLVVPPSEFTEASKLVNCQKKAVAHIRALAKRNHENALPKLQQRIARLGFQDTDLWMTLAWVREMAPIIVHLDLTKMLQFLEKDTHYRNQFETATSGGLLKPSTREKWEKDLFGGCYDRAQGFDRCKYGVLNAMNDHRGVVKCAQYGDSYLVLRDVRLRCTFSPEDSANLKAERLAVLDFYGHVLSEYSDDELRETMQVAKSSDAALLGDSAKVGSMKYKETQIHGELCFAKHVERLVAHPRHRKEPDQARVEAVAKKFGWKFSWIDEERRRMEREERAKLGATAWEERLQALMEKGTPDIPGIPPGFCKQGCGRKVAPGTTKSGKPFVTCCRGCVMGFGHDMHCGNIDPEKLGPEKCKYGCGRPVNPGRHPSGRPYDTCCRDCSSGSHDPMCGKEVDSKDEPVKPGFCKMRCGRRVAETKDGRSFDTCTPAGAAQGLQGLCLWHWAQQGLSSSKGVTRNRTVKLIDFGLATRFYGYLPQDQYIEIAGTSHYMAPEMMISGKYSPAVDMWSLGVLLYVCLTGLMLLPKDDDRKKHLLGKKAYVEKKLEKCTQLQKRACSAQARDLLRMMLKYDPAERISASEALSHPFILKHCHEYLGGAVAATTQLDETVIDKLRSFAKAPRLKKVAQLFMAHLAEHDAELLAARHNFRTLDQSG
ncbi:Calcium-dependent protein kinase 3 (Calcium-dependent protein kinase isoform CDPK6) (AtCDPK6), partial [Durusdinium trenchii]